MKKNILVTGSNGFIGKRLAEQLICCGYTVFKHSSTDGDISSCGLPYDNIDHVFHLAAKTFVPDSWSDPYNFYRVNVIGTENILEFCRKSKCSLTFMSTYVYGVPKYTPIDEKHPIAPNTPYNHSKVLAESLCNFYSDKFNIPITIIRPFNIYGSNQKSHFLIPSIINQLKDNKKQIIEVMDLRPKRDFLYIDDLIDALILTIESKGFSIYNVASGASISVEDVIKTILTVAGSQKQYVSKNCERKEEIMDVFANISKIKNELGWEPKTSLEEGILKTMN